jgi:hypothetical protein
VGTGKRAIEPFECTEPLDGVEYRGKAH